MSLSKSDRIYLVISIVFFFLLWTLKIIEDLNLIAYHTWAVRIGVPGYVGITFLYNWLAPSTEKTKFISIALLFAMLAEMINAANLDFGLLFFSVTHTCLTIFHWKKTVALKKEKLATKDEAWLAFYKKLSTRSFIVMWVLYLIFSTMIMMNLHEHTLEYLLVVPIYLFLLTLMGWRSIYTYGEKQSGRIILGSLLFYICDVFILLVLTAPNFDNPPLIYLVLSWITYLPALFLLSCIGKSIFTSDKYPNF